MPRLKRVLQLLVLLAVVLGTTAKTYAWNATGHHVVAYIAYLQLTEAERNKVVGMIRNHERFDEDFKKRMPPDITSADQETRDLWVFLQASVWPDIARGIPKNVRDKFHRPTWHYINQPLYLTEADKAALKGKIRLNFNRDLPQGRSARRNMNVIQAIKYHVRSAGDRRTSKRDLALDICWIMHLTGDIHQPMHSTALFSKERFAEGDRGGNLIPISGGGNLHSRWDGLLGRGLKLNEVKRRGRSLLEDADLKKAGVAAAASMKVDDWLDESHELAKTKAYAAAIYDAVKAADKRGSRRVSAVRLPESYFKTGGKVAQKRVVEAGFRLSRQLKTAVGLSQSR